MMLVFTAHRCRKNKAHYYCKGEKEQVGEFHILKVAMLF
jgi:hypothetical protein